MTVRPRAPKVTQADLDRAVELVRKLGLKPSGVEVEPGRVRILTGDLTPPGEEGTLLEELAEHRSRRHGHGKA